MLEPEPCGVRWEPGKEMWVVCIALVNWGMTKLLLRSSPFCDLDIYLW